MSSRPIRIANCSGALTDPGVHMYTQAKLGHVDFITGDYLAEANLAGDPLDGSRPEWIATALDGLNQSLEIIDEKRIKVIINGGGRNPKGLAEKVHQMVTERHLSLKVSYVEGDDLMHKVHSLLADKKTASSPAGLAHLDSPNPQVHIPSGTYDFLSDPESMPIVSANAYLGYRGIHAALSNGADIVICGRVSDASPVIAAAAWWHGWREDEFDRLARALVAGHLIECSTYATGANFAGSSAYPVEAFLDLGLPIAEIDASGDCVVTKPEGTGGFVTADTIKCQFLYELQGDVYLNSDVKADLRDIHITQEGKDRVRVTGISGSPPPPTTKLAVFYKGGWQLEILLNASGYATAHKFDVEEAQIRHRLQKWGALQDLDVLEFQRIGVPQPDADTQLASTTYLRIFAQAKSLEAARKVPGAWMFDFMAHFPGMHNSLDMRTVQPRTFFGYYPALIPQGEIEETATIIGGTGQNNICIAIQPPKVTEPLAPRHNYEAPAAPDTTISRSADVVQRPLGDIALARSGDKAGNVNIGLFVQTASQFAWFRTFMSRERLQQLMGRDWRDEFFVERVEFPHLFAVHFVVYGVLARGVSSSSRLDCLGKGFAEYIRSRVVEVPADLLDEASKL